MNFFQTHKRAITGISVCLLIGGITLSFQDTPFNYLQHDTPDKVYVDTVPKKLGDADKNDKGMSMKEFDELTANLDREIAKATDELKKIDWTTIENRVNDALKEVDVNKIQAEVANAMKEIDFEKIGDQVKDALKEVDMKDLNIEIQKAMNEASKEIGKVNMDEVKKEMEKAKLEVEKAKLEMKKIDLDKIMLQAKDGIDQAKAELKNISSMFTEMEKDGLISKKDGFKVEYKDKTLYLNGKKQTDEVTDKYRHYFKDEHFEITIDKSN